MSRLNALRTHPNALARHYRHARVEERVLLTGHSHQAWPDRGLSGQRQAWIDAMEHLDDKWEKAFAKARRVREGYAELLGASEESIALGANTHELLVRFLSARALRRVYAQEAKLPLREVPDPRSIVAILEGELEGHQVAASRAFSVLGEALGDALADAVCLTDSLVVIGGGIALGHRYFLSTAVARMNSHLRTHTGERVRRMEVTAYNLEDSEERKTFLSERPSQLRVPGTQRQVSYFADKSIGVGVSVLGTSEAVALGAYAAALQRLDAPSSREQAGLRATR